MAERGGGGEGRWRRGGGGGSGDGEPYLSLAAIDPQFDEVLSGGTHDRLSMSVLRKYDTCY